jgi:hypothetical protein
MALTSRFARLWFGVYQDFVGVSSGVAAVV